MSFETDYSLKAIEMFKKLNLLARIILIFLNIFVKSYNQTYLQNGKYILKNYEKNTSLHLKNEGPRVVGGFPCKPDTEVWRKSVLGLSTFWGFTLCTGTLISKNWGLTAAHCKPNVLYIIYVTPAHKREDCMKSNGNKNSIPWSCPLTRVSGTYIHPRWNLKKFIADIALLKLASPIYEDDNVNYVKLPSRAIQANGPNLCEEVISLGFGMINDKRDTVIPLMCAKFNLISEKTCKEELLKYYSHEIDTKICIKNTKTKNVCYGDSGGPLICCADNIQIGITSYSAGDGCESDKPTVFTRVDKYLKFIHETTSHGLQIDDSKIIIIYLFFCGNLIPIAMF